MPLFLDYDTVVAINAEFGGLGSGVADESGIRSAIDQPSQRWDGVDLYPTLWPKAAALMRGISAAQYFLDGNKRTGFLAATTFLELNGAEIQTLDTIFAEVFVLGVAAGAVDVDKAAEWFSAVARANSSE